MDVDLQEKGTNLMKKYSSTRNLCEEFLYEIFQWDPLWLDDKKYEETPPPIIDSIKMAPSQLLYSTFEEYQDIMFPFLIHEFWYVLKEDFIEEVKKKRYPKIIEGFIIQKSYSSSSAINNANDKMVQFKVITTIENYDRNESKYPNRGDLVMVECLNNKKPVEFGFISDVELSGKKNVTVTYEVKSKFCSKLQLPNKVKLTTVTWASAHITLIEALCYISESRLKKLILQPDIESFTISTVLKTVDTATKEILNNKQVEIMSRIIEAIKDKPLGIFLIQGPPGCGKSSVIKNIIATIMKNESQKKVLVCAPSNKAIDELVLKLLKVQPFLEDEGIPFKIVRVGREDKMHEAVKRVYLSNLRYDCIQNKFYYYPRRKYEKRNPPYEEFILKKANIITCTLTSSFTSYRMRSVFGKRFSNKLPFVIIDEAAQATELLTLVPAMLDIDKLVLVGDPQQLPPTVLSSKARDYGYDSSLFARAQIIFNEELDKSPIVMLDTQYRIVDSISQWPNRYFYKGAIKNAASVSSLDLCNYKLFNHSFLQEENGHSNRKEAYLIANLVCRLVEEMKVKYPDKQISIGVITPYKDQCKLIDRIINPRKKTTKQVEPQEILKRSNLQNEKGEIVVVEKERVDVKNEITNAETEKENSCREENEKKSDESNDNGDDDNNEEEAENVGKKISNEFESPANGNKKKNQANENENKSEQGRNKNTNDRNCQKKIEEEKPQKIQVNTVDSFQGSECDIIIMSCVRSEGIGFVKNPNRLNVSLTRAKHTLIMCGNFNTFRRDEMWESLLTDAESRGVYFNLTKGDELNSIIEHVIINPTGL